MAKIRPRVMRTEAELIKIASEKRLRKYEIYWIDDINTFAHATSIQTYELIEGYGNSNNLKTIDLIGNIDGINKEFYTPTNFQSGSLIYKNGLLLKKGNDYEEILPNKIVFVSAPSNIEYTDKLIITYKEKI